MSISTQVSSVISLAAQLSIDLDNEQFDKFAQILDFIAQSVAKRAVSPRSYVRRVKTVTTDEATGEIVVDIPLDGKIDTLHLWRDGGTSDTVVRISGFPFGDFVTKLAANSYMECLSGLLLPSNLTLHLHSKSTTADGLVYVALVVEPWEKYSDDNSS